MPHKIDLFQQKDLRQDVLMGGSSSSWQRIVYWLIRVFVYSLGEAAKTIGLEFGIWCLDYGLD